MKKTLLLPTVLLALATLLAFSLPAIAYQEINVENGGSIQGKAKMFGNMPHARYYHLVLFPNIDMCAEVDTDDEMNRVLDDFKISVDGGLKDVVITLERVEAGKSFNKEPIIIASENCKFFPDVNVIRQGETFQKKYKIMQMICGMHEFMQTWGLRVQNPYYFITDLDGNFNIGDIPPGEYVVNAWHYLMKPQKRKIKIVAGATIDLNFDFDGDKVARPFYETIKSGRIKKDAVYPGTAKGKELGR